MTERVRGGMMVLIRIVINEHGLLHDDVDDPHPDDDDGQTHNAVDGAVEGREEETKPGRGIASGDLLLLHHPCHHLHHHHHHHHRRHNYRHHHHHY